ncbi:TonB-dependent siderophore receptor [Undibacterium oligocarboniphilum]|uniref:TonB-dependent receptor n=1 Tax=Undibacterium oligocarboniphilum TaxID=666702 RepID=A0A850QG49_9BURK|nr:TonB-dependent receptor [Undibacterium oligocarboniphilum]MBC3870657.1 TonB-dependent receptor [Undibacterium oligocarboniphilum]NVO78541.1 TonB-dependent receptor [Undibacterium oligocarboniphilum]
MTSTNIKLTRMASLVSLALLQMGIATAQEASNQEKEKNSLNLNSVIVTGTPIGTSKMKASVSISSLDADQIAQSAPTNAAEILRAVPGVRAESSGGEGNANLTVRGVPISAGGARYVQFQEDGLPIMLFGDVAFATPDMYLRADGSLSHLEVVRGGTASTMATNSPGGIINFISKSGKETGGSIGITKGLNFDQTRYDFDYGAALSPKTRMFVAGFYRNGDSSRPAGVTAEDGGQIRANITQELDNGYIRLSVKHLDDKTPMNMPVPVKTVNGTISELPGIDPRTASFYSPYWTRDIVLDKNNSKLATNVNDGLHVLNNAFGAEASLNLGGGWTLDEKFRKSSNSGRFISLFPANNSNTPAGMTYATGPNAGKAYGGPAFTATVFNTSIDDLGSTVNDAKLSKIFDLSGGKLATTVGYFSSLQNVGLTWNFNQYLLQATGDKPALLNASTTVPGSPGLLAQGTDVWGGCCNRNIDTQYKTNALYTNLGWESGNWNLDASLRYDKQKASGTYNQAVNQAYRPANLKYIDYSVNHTSYSFGTNYRLTRDLALFARVSEGIAFNADRIMFGNPLDGSVPISTNIVKQIEGGVKWKVQDFSSFVTLFQAKTDESNFEATTQKFTSNSYDAKGVEVEASYRIGAFRMTGGMTYTNASIVGAADASIIGKTPRRQAKLVYQLAPTYTMGDAVIGASLIGTTKSYGDDANTITLGGFNVLNAFVNYQFTDRLQGSLSVNNLFNTIGYTEVEGDGHAARSINGRTVRATLKYAF